jgi:hypothetical protein
MYGKALTPLQFFKCTTRGCIFKRYGFAIYLFGCKLMCLSKPVNLTDNNQNLLLVM